MKYEITDVDPGEMVNFLERVFNASPLKEGDETNINNELREYGYELAWQDWSSNWEVYR